ncbi:unnamed protein product [Rotaria sordida]|uniref:adenylate cyclase n=1 Tax=Rotaria sordida TaxID=392033 RepID=A0A814VW93_9BILA|nr:unnamed protein product [Rotaria sordida]CAF3786262.1 unnamed protein product [Rotaria sordida]
MGLNFEPVAAGVIDDTINVASRMDSPGEKGCIQVLEHVALALKDKYTFESRGKVYVKEKSHMTTYFFMLQTKL